MKAANDNGPDQGWRYIAAMVAVYVMSLSIWIIVIGAVLRQFGWWFW
jgi:hypothetical protein